MNHVLRTEEDGNRIISLPSEVEPDTLTDDQLLERFAFGAGMSDMAITKEQEIAWDRDRKACLAVIKARMV